MDKNEGLNRGVVKGVSWMALFTYTTQGLSWVITIFVARLLSPQDYGLMGIATIFTGYADLLADLGLGTAIIQKKDVSKEGLSSVFWFSMGMGIVIAMGCMPLSFLTAYIMHEPRVIPIVQVIGIVFLFSCMRIVPSSLLRRELDFKGAGICESIGTVVSLVVVLTAAWLGAGVWSLVFSQISRASVSGVSYFLWSRWLPKLKFKFSEVKSYLNFGITVTVGRTLFYITGKASTFFAGRAWNAATLGMLSLAQELSSIPVDRITPLINQVCFPAFSKLQDDGEGVSLLYLRIVKITALLIVPICIGGACLGDWLVSVLLGSKWEQMIPLFRLLCLSQMVLGLSTVNGFVHPAIGHPKRGLYFQAICAVVMSVSFAIAVRHGFQAIIFPFLVSGTLLSAGWIVFTCYALKIPFLSYFRYALSSVVASLIMVGWIFLFRFFSANHHFPMAILLALAILSGSIIYCGIIWGLDRSFLLKIWELVRGKSKESDKI